MQYARDRRHEAGATTLLIAMPETRALSQETRTLIYLAVALAGGSRACVAAMVNKAKTPGIGKDKLLETCKIARFAVASRVFGNADALFESITNT
jgi:alkylhydroperoxidase/carboxymuconolactone decarboxylase family protein YurZ